MSLASDVKCLADTLNALKLQPADDTNMRERIGVLFVAATELTERFVDQPNATPPQAPAPQREPMGSFQEAMAVDLAVCPKCSLPADGPKESTAHPDWAPFYVCRTCKNPQNPSKNLLWSSGKKWQEIAAYSK